MSAAGQAMRAILAFTIMALLLAGVGWLQSWQLSLTILNMCLISAIMALGVNIQWGYAGLFNVGIVGFAALGGLAAVLVSHPPVPEAWAAGGTGLFLAGLALAVTVVALVLAWKRMRPGVGRALVLSLILVGGFVSIRYFFDPAVAEIEAVDPSRTGFLGGLGLPILLSWLAGGALAAGAAWLIGKVALGLRADYLAIATLGIAEIVISVLRNEDWLSRGVKNVTGLPRPVPYEIDLQRSERFAEWVEWFRAERLTDLEGAARAGAFQADLIEASSLFVKLCYAGLFTAVLLIILILCVLALHSPWGRMIRAIRDNEVAAAAMGKDVTGRHLQIFVLGSAVVGIAGAMLTTLDGQFTPGSYNPLRYTFLIWVMVIVGGSGNNLGAVIGGFLIWFVWIEAEPAAAWLMEGIAGLIGTSGDLHDQLVGRAQHMRLIVMGIVLLLVMRFTPGGILPERLRLK